MNENEADAYSYSYVTQPECHHVHQPLPTEYDESSAYPCCSPIACLKWGKHTHTHGVIDICPRMDSRNGLYHSVDISELVF